MSCFQWPNSQPAGCNTRKQCDANLPFGHVILFWVASDHFNALWSTSKYNRISGRMLRMQWHFHIKHHAPEWNSPDVVINNTCRGCWQTVAFSPHCHHSLCTRTFLLALYMWHFYLWPMTNGTPDKQNTHWVKQRLPDVISWWEMR